MCQIQQGVRVERKIKNGSNLRYLDEIVRDCTQELE